jgi:hypothetical protein
MKLLYTTIFFTNINMSLAFTNVGEFHRGKGTRKARVGPGMRIARSGTIKTPNKMAEHKLEKLLKTAQMSAQNIYVYKNMMLRAEQLRFMSMPVLASVLVYMNSRGDVITKDNFNYDDILLPIDTLLHSETPTTVAHKMTKEDVDIARLRMAATFIRYILYVTQLRSEIDIQAIAQGFVPELAVVE